MFLSISFNKASLKPVLWASEDNKKSLLTKALLLSSQSEDLRTYTMLHEPNW